MNSRLRQVFDGRPAGLWRWLLGGIAVAAALIGYLLFSSPSTKPAQPELLVKVSSVTTRPVAITENQIGTVVSVATVQVTAQVSGQLLSADFKEGQIVHKGDVIFRIDPKPFGAALEQARAALARDSATLANAIKDKQRYTILEAVGAASAQQRDQAIAAADADAATVKSDQAAVDVAQLNLGYTDIHSPIDGKTGPILVQPGNLIAANNAANPLLVITQLQPIMVSFSLPQSELPKLQDRMRAGALTATVGLHDGTQSKIDAPVDFIGNQVNNQTGTIELRATFANADYRLVPGQLVDVKASVADIPHALVVPREAVYFGPDSRYVYVVDSDSKAQLRTVNVLFDDGTIDAIEGAVKAGDRVVTEGQLKLTPGAKVTIVESPQSASSRSSTPAAP